MSERVVVLEDGVVCLVCGGGGGWGGVGGVGGGVGGCLFFFFKQKTAYEITR